jgi:primase-polymerase (primpol)-like protein
MSLADSCEENSNTKPNNDCATANMKIVKAKKYGEPLSSIDRSTVIRLSRLGKCGA